MRPLSDGTAEHGRIKNEQGDEKATVAAQG